MKRVLFLSMVLLVAWAQPVPAQDDSDDIKVDGCGEDGAKKDDGYDEEHRREHEGGNAHETRG